MNSTAIDQNCLPGLESVEFIPYRCLRPIKFSTDSGNFGPGVEVALEQQAPWGRPPFGALMQLCFGKARVLPVAITYLLSNRAEKPVCPPGPCCTLEFAVPSRPGGQQPK